MMNIGKDTLKKIAQLAKLNYEESQEEALLEDLRQILDWMGTLNELDTSEVAPLTHISEEINRMRENVASDPLSLQDALKNAAQKNEQYFIVPKVVDNDE